MPNEPSPSWPRNRLLEKLPAAEQRRLMPLLTPVDLPLNQVVYEYRGPVDHAYFPMGAVLSALTMMQDGGAIEVATVGNEGVVGHDTLAGSRASPHRMVVQIGGGGAWRIAAGALQEEAARSAPLRDLLTNYHSAFMAQISQSVACNGLHRLEQRCCRWLLMSRDRVGSDDLRLTHEYLSMMLGTRRASVTETLRPLQEAALVRSHRGLITILDADGLEGRACECYRVVRDEYDRLLGDPA